MNQAAERTDVEFDSGCDRCAAWLYRPAEAREPTPAVVLAPGLAGVRAAAVDGFAAHFAAAGMAALVFDYRGFGDSGGSPRQLMTVHRQLEDWHAPSRPPARCPASTLRGLRCGEGRSPAATCCGSPSRTTRSQRSSRTCPWSTG